MTIPCDGCSVPVAPAKLAIISANGIQCRYCSECEQEWKALEIACNAQAAVFQRQLKLFWQDARKKTLLRVTPIDFPAMLGADPGMKLG